MQVLKILMVDDNEDDRESFCRVLSAQSDITYEITQSDDGAEGIEMATQGEFDCVLLDYFIPGYDGLRVLRELQFEKFEQPILMLTGEGSEKIAVSAMKDGAQDYIVKNDALKDGHLSTAILTAIERRKEQLLKLNNSTCDSLTGIMLRRPFLQHLDQALKTARRQETTLALFYLDLDNFKPINDTFGHGAGDFILTDVARRITQCIREVDCVARFGGDEFVITLVDLDGDGIDDSTQICHRIADSIANHPFIYKNQLIHASLSIGVAISIGADLDKATLIEQADRAMYRAKENDDYLACFHDGQFKFERKHVQEKLQFH